MKKLSSILAATFLAASCSQPADTQPETGQEGAYSRIEFANVGLWRVTRNEEYEWLPMMEPRAEIEAKVAEVLGPPIDRPTYRRCLNGQMQVVPFDGLQIGFWADDFYGWRATESSDITTREGFGIGSSRSEVEAAAQVEEPQPGLLIVLQEGRNRIQLDMEGSGPEAKVIGMSSGLLCERR